MNETTKWKGMLIGTGHAGSGSSEARINLVLGDRTSAVCQAWVTALATPSAGHVPFIIEKRPGLAVRPSALFVPQVETGSDDHGRVTMGAAHSGVAAGISEAVLLRIVPEDVAATALLICSVWVDVSATLAQSEVIFDNNRQATLAALDGAGHEWPSAADVAADDTGYWNAYFFGRPTLGEG